MKKLRALFPAMLLLAVSCNNRSSLSHFTSDNTVRLEIDGTTVFSYEPATCQLFFNEGRCKLGASTDTMLNYFELTLSEIPDHTGNKVTGSVIWSTPAGERRRENVTLEAKRISGDVIWLCDQSRHTAAVVRVLE